jgi:hypothetical protein
LAFIQQTLLEAGGLGSTTDGPLTPAQIIHELDNGRPFIIGYQGSFSGHVVVVSGYSANSNGSNLQLTIEDPYFGHFSGIPYATTFTYGGQMQWFRTIFGVRRTF